jgi:hypothetical protein
MKGCVFAVGVLLLSATFAIGEQSGTPAFEVGPRFGAKEIARSRTVDSAK